MSNNPERLSFISGVGRSASGRRLGRTAMDLTLEAALEAIADAGLTREDIDGIATYPGGDAIAPWFRWSVCAAGSRCTSP